MKRKNNIYVEVAKIYSKNKSTCEIMKKKEKKNHASLAVLPQTAKVMARAHDKCFVQMEMVLNVCMLNLCFIKNKCSFQYMCCFRYPLELLE